MLHVHELQLLDLYLEHLLEETLRQVLVLLLAEQLLERHVDHRIDILGQFKYLFHNNTCIWNRNNMLTFRQKHIANRYYANFFKFHEYGGTWHGGAG